MHCKSQPNPKLPIETQTKNRLLTTICILLSIIGMAATFNFEFPVQKNDHELYHYILGSKYFNYLRYTKIYDATAFALLEDGKLPKSINIRNLENKTTYRSPETWMHIGDAVKSAMGTKVWSEFKKDVIFIDMQLNENKNYNWRTIFEDHGFNPGPIWLLYASPPLHAFELKKIYELLPYIDFLILIASSILLSIQINNKNKWVYFAAFWVFFGFFPGTSLRFPDWIFGSYLRFSWFIFIALALISLKKDNSMPAGFLLTSAALERVFPILFLISIFLFFLFSRSKTQLKNKKTKIYRLSAGAIIALLTSQAATTYLYGNATQEFISHILKHETLYFANSIGLRTLGTFSQETRSFRQWKLESTADSSEYKTGMEGPETYRSAHANALDTRFKNNETSWIIGGIILLMSLFSAITRFPSALSTTLLGTTLFFVFVNASHYYYILCIFLPWATLSQPYTNSSSNSISIYSALLFIAAIFACSTTESIVFSSFLLSSFIYIWLFLVNTSAILPLRKQPLSLLAVSTLVFYLHFWTGKLFDNSLLLFEKSKEHINLSAASLLANKPSTPVLQSNFIDTYGKNLMELGIILFDGDSFSINFNLNEKPLLPLRFIIRSDFGYSGSAILSINGNFIESPTWEASGGMFFYKTMEIPTSVLTLGDNSVSFTLSKGTALALYHFWIIE